VLIGSHAVKFIAFDPTSNTLSGVKADMPDLTDAFVAAAWLVKDSQPQLLHLPICIPYEVPRHRAWGINQAGQPMIGVSKEPIDSVS